MSEHMDSVCSDFGVYGHTIQTHIVYTIIIIITTMIIIVTMIMIFHAHGFVILLIVCIVDCWKLEFFFLDFSNLDFIWTFQWFAHGEISFCFMECGVIDCIS